MQTMKKNALFFVSLLVLALFLGCASTPHRDSYYETILNPKYPDTDFQRIDREVWELSKRHIQDLDVLATELGKIATNDWEKARAIYVWVTRNIAYDTESYFSGKKATTNGGGVLKTGKSVCAGYGNLFHQLAESLGLESKVVSGYGKGYSFTGVDPGGTNHAWNALFINGKWRLFDSTWGAGNVSGKRFHREYNEHYFNPAPNTLIFKHFPEDVDFQLLETPVTREEFFRLPNSRLEVFDTGIDPDFIIERVRAGETLELPSVWNADRFTVVEVPFENPLDSSNLYRFVIEAPSSELLIVNESERFDIVKTDGQFRFIDQDLRSGRLTFFLKTGENYYSILRYEVE